MASNGKLPWFQFYPADWLQDTRMLDLQSKGAWFEIINAMWTAPQRGVVSGTLEEFSLLLGCYIDVTSELLDRFERLKICDFEHDGNGLVTLKCRRMVREEAERRNTRERVAKFRGKKVCNGHVTPHVTDKKSEVRGQRSEEENGILAFNGHTENGFQNVNGKPKEQAPKNKPSDLEIWMTQLRPLYPRLDVEAELRRSKSWLIAHPGRKATKQFFTNWLIKADKELIPGMEEGKHDKQEEMRRSPIDDWNETLKLCRQDAEQRRKHDEENAGTTR